MEPMEPTPPSPSSTQTPTQELGPSTRRGKDFQSSIRLSPLPVTPGPLTPHAFHELVVLLQQGYACRSHGRRGGTGLHLANAYEGQLHCWTMGRSFLLHALAFGKWIFEWITTEYEKRFPWSNSWMSSSNDARRVFCHLVTSSSDDMSMLEYMLCITKFFFSDDTISEWILCQGNASVVHWAHTESYLSTETIQEMLITRVVLDDDVMKYGFGNPGSAKRTMPIGSCSSSPCTHPKHGGRRRMCVGSLRHSKWRLRH
jgi:hypothetical protein